jgi:hypothetical protein
MTDQLAAGQCPPHHWEITLVRLEGGLHDHYKCQRCEMEKDVARGQVTSWTRRGGRPAKAAAAS